MRELELLFVVALVLYTVVIWSSHIKHQLRPWMVWLFGTALTADLSGTIFLCVVSATSWQWTIHTISGVASLLIMALHFLWAVIAVYAHGRFEAHFHRFSGYAWLLWLVAFVSGLPLF